MDVNAKNAIKEKILSLKSHLKTRVAPEMPLLDKLSTDSSNL